MVDSHFNLIYDFIPTNTKTQKPILVKRTHPQLEKLDNIDPTEEKKDEK